MNKFFSWFKSEHKVKRWLLLTVVSVFAICYALSTIYVTNTIDIKTIIKVVIFFILGFVGVVVSYILMQKQTLENMVKQTDKRDNVKSLIYNKKVYSQGPKIVVIGGGNGLNALLRGLKTYTENITAVVTPTDYKIEMDNDVSIEVNDIKESIIALAKNENQMRKLLEYKFNEKMSNEISFGDLYLQSMQNLNFGFSNSIQNYNEVLNMTGKVIPVTTDEMQICADLSDGSSVRGKSNIRSKMSEKFAKIDRVYVSPSNCKAPVEVTQAIKEADAIIIGPGSLYTSIIPILLVKGVSKAIKESKAFSVYISNIMTEPGETYNYTLSEHIKALKKHMGEAVIDYCIYDTGDITPEYIRKYNMKGSEVVYQDIQKAKAEGIKLMKRDLAVIENKHIRHDSDKIASAVIDLICEDLKFKDRQNDPEYLILNQKRRYKKIKSTTSPKWKKQKLDKKGRSKFYSRYQDRIMSIKESNENTNRNIEIANRNSQMLNKVNNMKTYEYDLKKSKQKREKIV